MQNDEIGTNAGFGAAPLDDDVAPEAPLDDDDVTPEAPPDNGGVTPEAAVQHDQDSPCPF